GIRFRSLRFSAPLSFGTAKVRTFFNLANFYFFIFSNLLFRCFQHPRSPFLTLPFLRLRAAKVGRFPSLSNTSAIIFANTL
ncbi:MAG: hypothetical protein ACTHNW_01320, partial [Mucilaginibacter sp.]